VGARDPIEEASRLHDLAVSWRAQRQYTEALAASQQALALYEWEVGPDYPDVANVLHVLASTYEAQGHYAEGERLYHAPSL
jgi:kinesin light chain